MEALGRSFLSVRVGAKDTAARWAKAARRMRAADRPYAGRLADLARRHTAGAFCGFDEPLEAALFSVLIELLKAVEEQDVDP
ncbi:MAG: hypothetical protein QMD46_06680 [Methanomicrobiales archaeon]|nr:hypothetical protein [Methanomicrobiales archaeon]MDI6876348.1 hypothetical protein [Methanomicrobiales archaeon]